MTYSEQVLADAQLSLSTATDLFSDALPMLDAFEISGRRGYELDRPILHNDAFPVSLIALRLETSRGLIRSISADLPLATIPYGYIDGVKSAADAVKANIDVFKTKLREIENDGGINPTTWSKLDLVSTNGKHSYKLRDLLEPVLAATDDLVRANRDLFFAATKDNVDFSRLAETIAGVLRKADEASAQVQERLEAATTATSAAAEQEKAAKASADLTKTHETLAKEIRDRLAVIDGETKTKKSEADATLASAAALKKQVEEYTASLTAFKETLAERNAEWEKGKTDLGNLIKGLKAENETIVETIQRAKSMLATATNAGLTAAQEERYRKLSRELIWAGVGVYWSYAFLFLSISPLAAYVIGNWNTTIPFNGGLEYVANIGLRIFFLAPALLFVGFTNARYRKLFRLKHEYGFRASLAGAVEGFKTQAHQHGDDIAAVAFYQLGRNPAETIEGETDDPEWYEKLLEIMQRFSNRFGKSADAEKVK